MEHVYEDIVMGYVTFGGQRFVCPQFLLHDEVNEKIVWASNPDFVAIDFKEKTLYVIEVTTVSDISDLVKKINIHAAAFVSLLKKNLKNTNVEFQDWQVKLRAFVREAQVDAFRKKLNRDAIEILDAKARSLETILANWKWQDDAKATVNPLDGPSFS